MKTEPAAVALPTIITLRCATWCRCGELVAEGERAGYTSSDDRVVCLSCLADRQAGRSHVDQLALEIDQVLGAYTFGDRDHWVRQEHQRRVHARSHLLLNRLEAIRAMGTLEGEPRSLDSFSPRSV